MIGRAFIAGWMMATAGAAVAAPPVSFKADLVPVLKSRCAACHLTGKEAGNMALHPKAALASLLGRKSTESRYLLVAPGKPADSYLIMKLDGTHTKRGGSGERMPFGAPPLDAATIAKFKAWIAAGAKDN